MSVLIASIKLQHTCRGVEDSQQKWNYKMDDICNLFDAVSMYQPTANKEGNAKQLSDIAKTSTGFELR